VSARYDWLGAADEDGLRDALASPDPEVALAAAEVVAAVAGQPAAQLPEEVREWLEGRELDAGPLIPLANDAVARVGGAWADTEERQLYVVQLERRLGTR
jgi:hypothetical protein